MTTSTNPVELQRKLAKAASSLTIHVQRGKGLGTADRPNHRSLRMVDSFNALRRQAIEAYCWESYCAAANSDPSHTGIDYFA